MLNDQEQKQNKKEQEKRVALSFSVLFCSLCLPISFYTMFSINPGIWLLQKQQNL
jgi:hypothetical protein